MRKLIAFTLLLGALTAPLAFSAPAQALSCKQPNLMESAAQADIVVVGTVKSVKTPKDLTETTAARTKLRVSGVYKGVAPGQLTVWQDPTWGASLEPTTEPQIFLLHENEGKLSIPLCSPTVPADEEALAQLRHVGLTLHEPSRHIATVDGTILKAAPEEAKYSTKDYLIRIGGPMAATFIALGILGLVALRGPREKL